MDGEGGGGGQAPRVDVLCRPAGRAEGRAVKAVHRSLGNEIWGQSVSMMSVIPSEVSPPELVDRAEELDRHYIPAGYPNAHPGGAPADCYTRDQAEGLSSVPRGSSGGPVRLFRLDLEEVMGALRRYAEERVG